MMPISEPVADGSTRSLCRALVSSKAAFNDVLGTLVTRGIGLFFDI